MNSRSRYTTTLVLVIPDSTYGYAVYSDASCVSLGCIFIQRSKVVVYDSKQLKSHQQNYHIHDLGLEVSSP